MNGKMSFTRPVLDENSKIDVYAGNAKAYHDLLPIWKEIPLERKGIFYTSEPREGCQIFGNYLPGFNPLVVASPRDLTQVFYAGEERPFILYEKDHFTRTNGLISAVSLFLCEDTKDVKIRKSYAQKYQEVEHVISPKTAVEKIIKFIIGVSPKKITTVGGNTVGIIYAAFGDKAANAVMKSIATLKRVGYSFPVIVVGDTPVSGCIFKEWKGQSPFDSTKQKNFQYRAGRVKPFLPEMSPFDMTLYVDADTQFQQNILPAFELLNLDGDLVVTEEYLTVGELYNKYQAGWEINIQERDKTIQEGIDPKEKFINSGVFLFKKSERTKQLFKMWSQEWLRFQEWDEQLAFMRAIKRSNVAVSYLPPLWNDPQLHDDTIIYHPYGRGTVRMSK